MMSPPSHVLPTYQFSHRFVRGEGAYLFDDTGQRYLDFTSGIGVTCLGHCHPALAETVAQQSTTLWHLSNLFTDGGQERVASLLCQHSFADKVFFCNSGAEAIEAGIKLCRRFFQRQGQGERHRIIATQRAFHGRSLSGIAASGQEKLTRGFSPLPPGFDHVAFGDIDAMTRCLSPQTAAILVEPIQGEGGIYTADNAYLEALSTLAREHGCLLFFDEVQCGMMRSGKLFAHQWTSATPHVLATAKGLGGGFPVGACLCSDDVAQGLERGCHGSTFGGNPLAMAVAHKVLTIITEETFQDHVMRMAHILQDGLTSIVKDYAHIFSAWRGKGLMLGLVCHVPMADVLHAFRQALLLAVPASNNVLRLLPPLIIHEQHIDEALRAIKNSCEALSSSRP